MIKEYSISGMSCAACSASVERAVRRISGVDAASVNLSTEKLFVRSANDLSDEILPPCKKSGSALLRSFRRRSNPLSMPSGVGLISKKAQQPYPCRSVCNSALLYFNGAHGRASCPRVHHRTAGFRRYADDSAAARAFCRQSILCARNQGDIRTAPEYGFAYCRRHNCINCLFRLLNRTDIQRTASYDA